MAFCIETRTSNDYRCSCCQHTHDDTEWVESADALATLPGEFPVDTEWSSSVFVRVHDGSTGKIVAHSELTWPPGLQRGDPYLFTKWSLYIDEETFPGRGKSVEQILQGRRFKREPQTTINIDTGEESIYDPEEKLVFITDRSWSDILDELAQKKRDQDIQKAEAEKADAERRLAALRGTAGTA